MFLWYFTIIYCAINFLQQCSVKSQGYYHLTMSIIACSNLRFYITHLITPSQNMCWYPYPFAHTISVSIQHKMGFIVKERKLFQYAFSIRAAVYGRYGAHIAFCLSRSVFNSFHNHANIYSASHYILYLKSSWAKVISYVQEA